MRLAAPGKLVLAGAYAVLEGSPALVCAVNRYARAEDAPDAEGDCPLEVRAALENPPAINVHELMHEGRKLGLGSSAAALVAALALRAAERGQDVASDAARKAIFDRALDVHATVQQGGSGIDVAASTFGGVLRYTMASGAERVELPAGIYVEAFFSGTSARTSDLRARVDELRTRDARSHAARIAALDEIARAADAAIRAGDAQALIEAIADSGPALGALGDAAGAPIVPEAFAKLGLVAAADGAAFVPSGAGGGDVGVFLGTSAPSASFIRVAEKHRMRPLTIGLDRRGVHVLEESAHAHVHSEATNRNIV